MYCVYLLENQIDKSWYIGFTTNLKRRIFEQFTLKILQFF
jgi:predicted GIY-YIG superfamily endonuclease